MKIKTADLIDLALDWAVAKCLGATKIQPYEYNGRDLLRVYLEGGIHAPWEPSRYWAQGGPIIEREMINVKSNLARMREHPEYDWLSDCPEKRICVSFSGPTPLIAAMRCFVDSRLGYEVDVPDELVNQHED